MDRLKNKYRLKHEKAVWAKIASNYILIILRRIPNKNLYMPTFAINKATVDILDGLCRGEETRKIIKKLAKNYSLSPKRAMRDFKSILAALKKQDLIY